MKTILVIIVAVAIVSLTNMVVIHKNKKAIKKLGERASNSLETMSRELEYQDRYLKQQTCGHEWEYIYNSDAGKTVYVPGGCGAQAISPYHFKCRKCGKERWDLFDALSDKEKKLIKALEEFCAEGGG